MKRGQSFHETSRTIERIGRGLQLALCVAALIACGKREPPAAAATEAPAAAPAEGCSPALDSGFADPQQAYAHYAEALNAGAWCRAINTFARAARPSVALANFKGLAILAGAENPKREAYLERLRELCAQHALDCAAGERSKALAHALLGRAAIETELPGIARLAQQRPEALYVGVMRSLAGVDPGSMSAFDVPLLDVAISGDRATGTARPRNRPATPLAFARGATGWLLTFE